MAPAKSGRRAALQQAIEAVNKALSGLAAEGKIAGFGRQAGLTYLPPREPAILGDVWTKIIQR